MHACVAPKIIVGMLSRTVIPVTRQGFSAVYNYRDDATAASRGTPSSFASSPRFCSSFCRLSRGLEIHRAPRRPEAHFQKPAEGRRHKQVPATTGYSLHRTRQPEPEPDRDLNRRARLRRPRSSSALLIDLLENRFVD